MLEAFITPAELAARWNLAAQTIHNRIARGEDMPPSLRLGNGRRRFRLADVEEWERSRIQQTAVGE